MKETNKVSYNLEDIKEAFIKYYHSGRTVFPEETLTQDQDDEREFNDFLIQLRENKNP